MTARTAPDPNTTLSRDTGRAGFAAPLDAVVAVYDTEEDLSAAIKQLEKSKVDMSSVSVLGKTMVEDRHIVGFDTPNKRIARWATWGGLWGWVFAALVFLPGVGHVAVGGYLLYLLVTGGIGAAGGAFGGALTSIGIPEDGVVVYEADLRADRFLMIAHGSPAIVDRIRSLLAQTTHSRLDHHHASGQNAHGAQ